MANKVVRRIVRYPQSVNLLLPLVALLAAGCGGGLAPAPPVSPAPPAAQSCSAVVISGTMIDSITLQPVAHALAVLESGSPSIVPGSYNFAVVQSAAADGAGVFHLCVPTLVQPAEVVLVAMDATGKTYPPFLSPVSATLDLGSVPMGGCSTICGGFPLPVQTAASATITGEITTTPTAEKGVVIPQFVINAPGSNKDFYSLLMPTLNPAELNTFSTAPGACPGNAPFCAAYTFTLPSQSPVQRIPGTTNTTAPTGPPGYLMYATISQTSACKEALALTIQQKDSSGFLTGAPGAQLTAADLDFTGCH